MAVSGYNTVTSFFDESGKFKDHRIIAFGGIASYNENISSFAPRSKHSGSCIPTYPWNVEEKLQCAVVGG
jgi:hypothetical protein